MDPLTQLPLECLQRILQHIQSNRNKKALDTLFSLLRVSRYIATVTIPFIYHDPFNGHGTNTLIVNSLLTQTLLSSNTYCATIHSETCNDPLTNAAVHLFLAMRLHQFLRSSPLSAASTSTQFDYLGHVRHINHTRYNRRQEYSFWPASNSLSTEETAYIEEHLDEVELQCQLDDVTVAPDFSNIWSLKKGLIYYLHGVSLLRETTWALAVPILGQLESLTIPLSDIRRYRAVVDRLGRLERICFLQDEIYEFGDTIDEGSRVRRDEAMRTMVVFVEAHARCHPGRLKDVYCETNSWPIGFNLYFPDEIKLQVYRALPPPTKQTILNMNNCLPVLARPQTVDLGHVEQIYQEWNGFPWLEKVVREEPRFLQKCRRLKSIRMNSLGRGSFDWAVRERRSVDDDGFVIIEDTDNFGTNNNNDDDTNNENRSAALPLREGSVRWQQQQHRVRMVPLESMHLYKTTYDREIDDIAFAFSRTLRSLTVGTFLRRIGEPLMEPISTPEEPIFPTRHIGRGWVDMRLKILKVNGNGARLMLDPFLFAQCPDLIDVDLSDSTTEYQCQEIPLSLPAQLNSVEKLKLQGLPALSFHPATFETTTKLKKLRLSVEAGSHTSFFIPPVEELAAFYDGSSGAGSLWTWDWHLPQLTELNLTGEFAYRFQFRMLRGCPALRLLGLNMTNNTDTGEHIRILTIHDFSAPDTSSDTTVTSTNTTSINTDVQKQTPTHIVLQSLQYLIISGTWIFDDSVIPLLLHEMCPTIRSITLQGCSGFTSTSITNTLRTTPNPFLDLSLSSPPPSAEERVQLGMYSLKEWVKDKKKAWDFKIQFQGEQFFLLRDPEVLSCGRYATGRQG